MSYLKAIWLRPAAGVLVVLAVAALWLMGANPTEAGADGSVVITPANSQVGVGGTTTVSVDVTAPDGGLSVWIIEIGYDPAVVQVDTSGGNPVCTSPAVSGTSFHGEGCAAKDVPPAGGANDTAVSFGAWVLNVGGVATGWTGTNTVATFTFRAVGTVGQSSPLTVNVAAGNFLRPDAVPATPTETDGMITIIEGTPRIWGNSDCSLDGVTSRDAQAVLKIVGQKTPLSQEQGCPLVGAAVTVGGIPRIWGNWDCSPDGVTSRDAQAVLKIVGQKTPLSQEQGCPLLDTSVNVS